MADTVGIGELALQAGVSRDTLRHYERLGLLPTAPRTPAGYRRFPPDTIRRVRLIRRALAIGFSLADLRRVLRERDRGGAPCREVRALVGERLDVLEERVRELVALRGDLRRLVAEWDRTLARTPPGQRAHLLDALPEPRASSPPGARPPDRRRARRPS